MSVYRVAVGGCFRYIRAESALQARLSAFRLWGKGKPLPVQDIGTMAPEIGRRGYEQAVQKEPLYIMRQPSGKQGAKAQHKAPKAGPVNIFNPEYARLFAIS